LSGGVFELYPLSPGGLSTLGTRIGFSVSSLDAAIAALAEYPGAIISPPKDSEWGRAAQSSPIPMDIVSSFSSNEGVG